MKYKLYIINLNDIKQQEPVLMVLAFNGISKQAYSHGFIPKNELISFCFLPPPSKKYLIFLIKKKINLYYIHTCGV